MAGRGPDPALYSRLVMIVGGLFLTALSWVWLVAQRAKSCASGARTSAAKNEVAIGMIRDELKQMHDDQKDGFRGVHARLDKLADRE